MNGKWVVFLGPPGCGKGTQSEYLVKEKGFFSLSTGDLLRSNINKVIDEYGKTIGEVIGSGSLLPDHVTVDLISDKLRDFGDVDVLFDGFPRTIGQAEALDEMCVKFKRGLDKVINFVIDDDVIIKRILGRFKCSSCGKIYNEFFLNTKIANVCDVCGGKEFDRRSDDNEESLKKRLAEYHSKTYPLIDFYSKSGILYNVDADAPLEEVKASVLEVLY